MTTALIAACFSEILRAVGSMISVIIAAEFFYFLLFAKTAEENIENKNVNPYHFRNTTKLIAKALSFIFFIQPGRDRFSVWAGKKSYYTAGNNSFSDRIRKCLAGKNHSSHSGRNRFSVSDKMLFPKYRNDRFYISGNDHSSFTRNIYSSIHRANIYSSVRRKVVTGKLFTNLVMQNLTTCL